MIPLLWLSEGIIDNDQFEESVFALPPLLVIVSFNCLFMVIKDNPGYKQEISKISVHH